MFVEFLLIYQSDKLQLICVPKLQLICVPKLQLICVPKLSCMLCCVNPSASFETID